MKKTMLCLTGVLAVAGTALARHPTHTRKATTVNGKTEGLFLLAGGRKQLMPRAVKPLFETDKGCKQDIYLPCFNFLKRTNVQASFFGKAFLGNLAEDARAPQISTEFLKLNLCFTKKSHCKRLHENVC